MSDVVLGSTAKAAWLRFFRYLRMMRKESRSIMNPRVGNTTERTIVRILWAWCLDVELAVKVAVEAASEELATGAIEGAAVAGTAASAPK